MYLACHFLQVGDHRIDYGQGERYEYETFEAYIESQDPTPDDRVLLRRFWSLLKQLGASTEEVLDAAKALKAKRDQFALD